ncbi:MAG: cation:proton antiporter, partial [Desulfobacterales bacterium]
MRAFGCMAVGTIFLFFSFPLADALAGESGRVGLLNSGIDFLWIAIIILGAKLSNLVERFGQPAVLGELLFGVVLGNMALAGFNFFEPIRKDIVIRFLADIGVVILLFQVGLESNTRKMLQVGPRAFLVAIVGVTVPFFLGTVVAGPLLLPE